MMLSDSQKIVLKAIAELKKSSIGKIAQKTGMHRQSVKIIMGKLLSLAIIKSEHFSNKIVYSLNDISAIKTTFDNEFSQMELVIPSLKAAYESTKDSQIINAVSGRNGLRTLLLDEIIKGKEVCAFHVSPLYKKYESCFNENDSRRMKRSISLRILANTNASTTTPIKGLSKRRKIAFKNKIDLIIYANKVTLFYDNLNTDMYTIKLNGVAQLFRDIFEKKWKEASKE